jgi:hypothetical protein
MSQTVAANPVDKQGYSGRLGQTLQTSSNLGPRPAMPNWLPDAVRLYLDHTEEGLSLRALARREGCHASTVMRQVRRYESRRDDPLVDEALGQLGRGVGIKPMKARVDQAMDEVGLRKTAGQVLRHLLVEGTFLAIAADMDKAMVIRQRAGAAPVQLARVERVTAQAFALKEWIVCAKPGRVSTYGLTPGGRLLVRRLAQAAGLDCGEEEEEGLRRGRYGAGESPVVVLGRRMDKGGKPFLEAGLVQLAERLHEDFELAQMGEACSVTVWESWLNGGGAMQAGGQGGLPQRAQNRVALALRHLGPGLGDVVLHCCCRQEGLEAVEQRLGWAARSGKIVLRIALEHLKRYSEEHYGPSGPLIG